MKLYRVVYESTEYIEADNEEEAIEKVCRYHRLEPDAVTEVEED